MSSAVWVFVGLLFISPLYDASEGKDESREFTGRQRRSLANLKGIIETVTGRAATDFISYGHWCGLGGSGKPVDPIDQCCQNHDFCYNRAEKGVCRNEYENAIYKLQYRWRLAGDETAVCEDEDNPCKMGICICDVIIANCVKSNIDFYDSSQRRVLSYSEMIDTASYLMS